MENLRRSDRARMAIGLIMAALLAFGGPWRLAVGFFSHPVGGFSHHREVIGFYANGQTSSAGYGVSFKATSTHYYFFYIDVRRGIDGHGSGAITPQPDARSSHKSGAWLNGYFYACKRSSYHCSVRQFNYDVPISSFNPDPLLRNGTFDTVVGGCRINVEWTDGGDLYRSTGEGGEIGEASVREGVSASMARYTKLQGTVCGVPFSGGYTFGYLYHYLAASTGAGRFD
jgi:hypothetical protein